MTIFFKISFFLIVINYQICEAALDSDWDAREAAFPLPSQHMKKVYINSGCSDDTPDSKVEFILAKEMLLPAKDIRKLNAEYGIKQSYQFQYFEVVRVEDKNENLSNSKRAKLVKKTVESSPKFFECNFKINPLVVYVPEQYDVKYRIWTGIAKTPFLQPKNILYSSSGSLKQ